MCSNYQVHKDAGELEDYYDAQWQIHPTEIIADVRPTDLAPVISSNGEQRLIELARWGWGWQEDGGKKHLVINTRAEKIKAKKNFYQKALEESRCLIPTTGFIEHLGEGKNKQKTLFNLDGELFSIGGYTCLSEWRTGESAYSMITVSADHDMKGLHLGPLGDCRQPFLIPKELEASWLDSNLKFEEVLELMTSYPMGLKLFEQGQLRLL